MRADSQIGGKKRDSRAEGYYHKVLQKGHFMRQSKLGKAEEAFRSVAAVIDSLGLGFSGMFELQLQEGHFVADPCVAGRLRIRHQPDDLYRASMLPLRHLR